MTCGSPHKTGVILESLNRSQSKSYGKFIALKSFTGESPILPQDRDLCADPRQDSGKQTPLSKVPNLCIYTEPLYTTTTYLPKIDLYIYISIVLSGFLP